MTFDDQSIADLREEFCRILGYSTTSRSRTFLIRKILWGRQMQKEGDICETAKKRALEIADERDLHFRTRRAKRKGQSSASKTSKFPVGRDSRLPIPGAILSRSYQGKEIQVLVLEQGFEFDGKRYPSLSAIARQITGTRWNGYGFFNLTSKR